MSQDAPLLQVQDVSVRYGVGAQAFNALDRVNLELHKGEIVAVVGESGCGKTTLAKCVLGLQKPTSGKIIVQGKTVEGTSKWLAKQVGMVWQDPTASLDPRWKLRKSIQEPLVLAGKNRDLGTVVEDVGLTGELVDRFPHQLSGGQRQRAAIGRALVADASVVICDEPTAALDLSVQAQILNLIGTLKKSRQCGFLYISHDLLSVRYLADRVFVMVAGIVVESGNVDDVFERPRHPYTRGLLDAIPTLETIGRIPAVLAGEPGHQHPDEVGCVFRSRCPKVQELCLAKQPEPEWAGHQMFRCYFPEV